MNKWEPIEFNTVIKILICNFKEVFVSGRDTVFLSLIFNCII